jgi:hypothetical protein
VLLTAYVPEPGGHRQVKLEMELIHEFLADPTGYIADKIWRVSKSDYVQWLEENQSVRCSALTRSKKRCKQILRGGLQVTPTKWADMHGNYCFFHEDET